MPTMKWTLLTIVVALLLNNADVDGKTALLIIDVQNCFLPGGSLAVADSEPIIGVINGIRRDYESKLDMVVLSQDWHCAKHVSFASQHAGKNVYDVMTLQYNNEGQLCEGTGYNIAGTVNCSDVRYNVEQTLWPDHCVKNTPGALFGQNLTTKSSDVILRKGNRCDIDSYSVFYDNGGFSSTTMHSTLQSAGIDRVLVVGLALDYCLFYTARDAAKLKYNTYVILDATRPVNKVAGNAAVKELKEKGVTIIDSRDLEGMLTSSSILRQSSAALCLTSAISVILTFGTRSTSLW